MRHLVIIPDTVTSKRLSAVEMARRLRCLGYRITFVGSGGDYQQIDDFDYFRLDLDLDQMSAGSRSGFVHPERLKIAPGKLQDWKETLKKLSPDLLLIDVEAHVFVLAALASKHPVVLFSVFFNMRKNRSMPPLHFDIIPGRGLSGQPLIIELAWLRFRLSKFVTNKRERIKNGGRDKLSKFGSYATLLGLRLADHVDCYHWLIPFLYRSLPVLVLNPLEMEFPFHPHHTHTYVGPMICSDRSNLPFLPEKAEISSEIQELLDSYRQQRDGRRLIYCSFGCFFGGNDRAFWKKLIEAFRHTDWEVIFALGNRLNPDSLGERPENIHCLDFAPQMDILSIADCAVIHAGMTTVYECILHGVPMVTYPFKVNDQMGTAARMVYHHIGLRGNREKDSPADIRNHVEWAMHDQELKENIGQMQRHLESYQKNNTVADAVGRLIETIG